VRTGAIKIKYNIPIEANPDHSQNQTVSSTSNQPPEVKKRMKKGNSGADTTFVLRIVRISAKYTNKPKIEVRT
jgi:hypothetical protein